jgi:hypothetical protein
MQVAVNFAGIDLMIATAAVTARSSAASPSLSGHGFDFLNGFHATG